MSNNEEIDLITDKEMMKNSPFEEEEDFVHLIKKTPQI